MVTIAIVGFGLSGISACRWATHYGFQPKVYEKNEKFGGVWLTHNYINCILQTTKYSYRFSDMSMPENYEIYPKGSQVYDYLEKYIEKHQLNQYVQYNSIVQSIKKIQNKWEIIVNGERYIYDYLIISTGFYGEGKNPLLPFSISPNNVKNPIQIFQNKDVFVIGNGPSGCDMACLSVESGAKSVNLLYRTPRWIFSRYLGSLSLHFFTWRIFLTIAYYLPQPLLRLFLMILFMIPIFWYGCDICVDFPNDKVTRYNLVLNDNIYIYLKLGKLKMKRDPIIEINDREIITQTHKYSYDILIDATGYQTGIPLIGFKNTIPKLYRNILMPGDNTIGFIGFVASFSWVQISELQCHWFYQQLLGKFQLPTPEEQRIVIGKIVDRDYHDYAYLVYYYFNLLRTDMGLRELNHWLSLPEKVIFDDEI